MWLKYCLNDRIMSLRGDVWVHIDNLTVSLFIEMTEPCHEREQSCTCM